MNCRICNSEVRSEDRFCEKCGTPQYVDPVSMQFITPAPQPENWNNQWGTNNQHTAKPLGMGWYKFQIYFLLFASVVINLFSVVTTVIDISDVVKNPDDYITPYIVLTVEGINIFIVLVCVVLAVLARQFLAHYRQIGVTFLISLYILNIIGVFLYNLLYMIFYGWDGYLYGALTAVVSVVMIIVNIVYYNNRKEMFH